jgi:CheY-like chemotaxis protein
VRQADAPVVLFVTHDEDLRAVAKRSLAREGYEVVTASHAGHAVLACLGDVRVDVVVAEMAMPDMSGPMLAERLRRYRDDLPVIFLAGPGTPACDGVVVRPFTRDDLVVKLEAALAVSVGA